MPVCNNDILACISLLVVNNKVRRGTANRGARRGDGEPRGSKRRYDTMLGFVSEGRDRDPVTEG